MWPARAALRPVPPFAVVSAEIIESVENELTDARDLESRIEASFQDLVIAQPSLFVFLSGELDGLSDETAQALVQFLGVTVLRAFQLAFGQRLRTLDDNALSTAKALYDWDEELRRGAADEALESDDVVAIGQPSLVSFVREQLHAALEPDEDGEPADVDLDAIASVYRAALIEIIALGQSVASPRGSAPQESLQ